MAEYATKEEVQEIVDKAVTDLSEIIANFAQQVDSRFNSVEAKQQELDKKFDRLLGTIDSFVGRIDRYESEQVARDSQFNLCLSGHAKFPRRPEYHLRICSNTPQR